MDRHETALRRLRGQLAALLTLRYAMTAAAIWCFAWGVAVIVLRVGLLVDRAPLVYGAIGLAVAAAMGLGLAWRKLPGARQLRAAIDRHAAAGGLVMAAAETDLGGWQERTGSAGVPSLNWRGGRMTGIFLAGLAFVAVTFALPDRLVAIHRAQPLDVRGEAEQLTAQIETLEQEKIMQPDAAEQLRKQLEQVQREARGDDPVKTWAALDRMAEQLSAAARQSAQDAAQSTEKQAAIEAMAKALEQAGSSLPEQELAEAMADLAAMAQAAIAAGALPMTDLDEDMLKKLAKAVAGMPGGELPALDAQTLKKLAEAAKNANGQCQGQIARLIEAKMVDGEMARACENADEAEIAELVKWLKETGGECDGAAVAGVCQGVVAGSKPGRGGITRGRGDADMTWQDETNTTGMGFKEQALPPASMAALKESKLIGVSSGDPTNPDALAPAPPGALGGATGGGGAAHTHTILPRHRGAVERYFDRKQD